jgi:hypothetical protein
MTMDHDALVNEDPPPSAARVLARAYCLELVAFRGAIDRDSNPAAGETFLRACEWLEQHGFASEVEAEEMALLETPLGNLAPQSAYNAQWRVEGSAVLAWSIGALEMPPHDSPADIAGVWSALGLLRGPILEPRLRPADELTAMHNRLINIDWRFEIYATSPDALIDFRALRKVSWFGPFDLAESALANDDLSIAGKPLSLADKEQARVGRSIARERHRAIAWLLGQERRYSDIRLWR